MDATSQAMKLHFSNKKHLDGERIALLGPALLVDRLPAFFFLVSTLARPATSLAHIFFSLSVSFFSLSLSLYSRGVILISSRARVLSGRSSVSVFIAWRNRRVPGKLLSRVETRDRTHEPFLPTASRGAAASSSTRIAEKKHVEPVFQLKALIAVFTAFSFWKKGITAPAPLRPASRRACGFARQLLTSSCSLTASPLNHEQ